MAFIDTLKKLSFKRTDFIGTRGSVILHYLFAIAGTLMIAQLQLSFSLMQAPLFSMYFWCLFLTYYCGLGPGIFTSLMSTLVGNYFFLTPMGQFSWHGQSGYFSALFALMTLTSVSMFASVQRYAIAQRDLLNHEQKIAQQNEALAKALQKAVSARDDFLAIAGHELKTPVTALSLQAQSWNRRLSRPNPQMSAEAARVAWDRQMRGLERLASLIDELLDVSGLNRGQLTFNLEPLDLREVVQEVTARYSHVAADSKCLVTVHAAQSIWGDYDRMRIEQVLANLFTNALKYGAGRPVHVNLRQEGHQAIVQVRDQGRGIAPADQRRIFECYERAKPDPSTSGLGLGLWIARQIVDAAGGSIHVTSAVGAGSEFTVCLPLQQHVPPQSVANQSMPKSLS